MEGLQNELKEYRALYWPHGRCTACEFPLPEDREACRVLCPDKQCKGVLQCARPECEGKAVLKCHGCNYQGCKQQFFRCSKCHEYECFGCYNTLGCEYCSDADGDECTKCQGPFEVHEFTYANNVKRRERQVGCRDCIDDWRTHYQYVLRRDCEQCALEEKLPGMKCAQARCPNNFCHHADPDRRFCDAHEPMSGGKKQKTT